MHSTRAPFTNKQMVNQSMQCVHVKSGTRGGIHVCVHVSSGGGHVRILEMQVTQEDAAAGLSCNSESFATRKLEQHLWGAGVDGG